MEAHETYMPRPRSPPKECTVSNALKRGGCNTIVLADPRYYAHAPSQMLRIQMQLLSRDTNDCVSTCFSTRSWSYHRARHELITPGLTSLYLSENSLRQQHESNLDVPYFGFLTQLNVPIPPIPIIISSYSQHMLRGRREHFCNLELSSAVVNSVDTLHNLILQ